MKKLTTLTAAVAIAALVGTGASADDCSSPAAHGTKEKVQQASAVSKPDVNIVQTAVNAEQFTTLIAAVKAAGLVEVLSGEGPFTVFAPTDDAFAALPEGTVEALLKDKEKLTAILTYHVVAGSVMAQDVVQLDKAETLQGQNVSIKTKDGTVMIDGARVVKADIAASNGVIHVIDKVIMPDLK